MRSLSFPSTNAPTTFSALRLLLVLCACFVSVRCYPQQFTFEVEDGDERCFHALLKPQKYIFLYQVIYGGQLDVDVKVIGPHDKIVSQAERASHDEVYFTVEKDSSYTFCFGNSFSAMSHKRVYFELRPELFESLSDEAGELTHQTVLSHSENTIERAHITLSRAESLQASLKNRELGDRMVAEDLNTAVMLWSCAVTTVILVTTLGQVTVLKQFFSDKKIPHSYQPLRS